MSTDLRLFPELASTIAWQVDALYLFIVVLSIIFTVGIFVAVVYLAVKYRRRSENERPKAIHGSIPLELSWSIIPFFMAIFVYVWGADVYFRLYRIPADAMDVYVVGKQWMWKIQHPDGKREINELHVPVNQRVRVTLASEDVIHSFFIPAFRVKKDAVPGRYTQLWFEATQVGEYHLFCAEYCGTEHSTMIGKVIVMEAEDYQDWLSGGGSGETMAQTGERQFQQLGCQTCHKSQNIGRGPTLTGVFGKPVQLASGETVVADEAYVRESILNPSAKIVHGYTQIMPTFQGQVSEETLMQIIAYIKTLSADE
jgi:cytochrome c oxidase subunit 2